MIAPGPVVFIKDQDISWDQAVTLEDAIKTAIKENRDADVVSILKLLPEASRIRYRKIWIDIKKTNEAKR